MLAKFVVVWITTSVILTSAATTERAQSRVGGRILVHGGRPVQPGEFPFLVLLEITSGDELGTCSGSIPSPTTVLTAAHCDVGGITAYAGIVSNKEKELRNGQVQARSVESKAKHVAPDVYDIMVCHVNQSWEWTEFVAPVAVHLTEKRLQPSFVIVCQVMGFGETGPDSGLGVAHVMDQLIGSSAQCMDVDPLYIFLSFHMCSINVETKTICRGDSGGPAVCGGLQWAVSVGETTAATGRQCLPPKGTNIYVQTAYFRRWIIENIKDLPSSADSILHFAVKISLYEVLLYPPLWLLLSMTYFLSTEILMASSFVT